MLDDTDDDDAWIPDPHARDVLRATLAVDPIADSLVHSEEFNPGHIMGDSVVNGYMRLLVHGWRVVPRNALRTVPSAYYEALKDPDNRLPRTWLRGPADVLLPACDEGHWRLLCLRPRRGCILVYDSLPEPTVPVLHPMFMRNLSRAPSPATGDWKLLAVPCPRQSPGDNDCALWLLYNLEALVCGEWSPHGDPPPVPPPPEHWIPSRRKVLHRIFALLGSSDEVEPRRKRLPPRPIMLSPP